MKWFKHFSTAQFDPKILRVIKKYGLRGYGLYFACLENISNQLTPEKPMPDMEQSDSDIAQFFGEDTALITEMLAYFIQQGLFKTDTETQRLVCLKMLEHLDVTMSSNPQIRNILSKYRQSQAPLIETNSDYQQLITDQIRLDQIRLDKKKKRKVVVEKQLIELPYSGDDFAKSWCEFLEHRKEMRKPATYLSQKRMVTFLSNYPEPEAVRILQTSIERGWLGLFPPAVQSTKNAQVGEGAISKQLERIGAKFGK